MNTLESVIMLQKGSLITVMRIQMPEKVKKIIETLTKAGYEAYAVGGCVRDSLLGRRPDDWDITTSATPQQVKALFRRTIDTGIQHGTVTVMLEREGFEVTTYRIDGEYEDSRHPRTVAFTASLEEDLKRRDFTINAMAYNDTDGLIDRFGGMEDIRQGVIRAVGNPQERFEEDALRIMRAVRFGAQLNYRIEENTKAAITRLAKSLAHISAERIQTELIKLLLSDHPEHMRILYEMGITAVILPEFDRIMITEQKNPHHCYSVGEHTIEALQKIEADKVKRLAILFHDMGKPDTRTVDEDGVEHFHGHAGVSEKIADSVLRRLKFDLDTICKVKKIVRFHDYRPELSEASVRRGMSRIGVDIFAYLFEVQRADILAQSAYGQREKLEAVCRMEQLYQQILDKQQCISLKDLAVKGDDLIALGMKPGKVLGEVLQGLLEWVLEHPQDNQKEILTALPIVAKYLP